MRSTSLSIAAIALLGTAMFGGCTYSKSTPGLLTSTANQASTPGSVAGSSGATGDTAGTGGTGGTATSGDTTPPAVDVCQADDISGAVQASDWSQQIASYFGRPVNAQCNSACAADSTHTPWDLHVHLSGTFFTSDKDYSFSFIKDAYKSKVIAFQIARDAADPDKCPDNTKTGCWATCDGQCLDSTVVLKDSTTMNNDAATVLVNYLNDTCKIGLTVTDITGSGTAFKTKLKAAMDGSSVSDFLQCAEGLLLTATQVVPWIDSVLKEGIYQDDTGAAYTPDQIYTCVKKQVFDKALAP